MSRADSFAVNDKAVQDFVLEGEISEAEVTAGAAQGRKWFSLRRFLFGFLISLTPNGYIVFPVLLGGLIIQWGTSGNVASETRLLVNYPIAFPNAVFAVVASYKAANTRVDHCQSFGVANVTTTSFEVENQWVYGSSAAAFPAMWFAFGR